MVKTLIFRCFVELTVELENDEKRVDGTDIPVSVTADPFQNVKYPPIIIV